MLDLGTKRARLRELGAEPASGTAALLGSPAGTPFAAPACVVSVGTALPNSFGAFGAPDAPGAIGAFDARDAA
jgi:hypothetical protein